MESTASILKAAPTQSGVRTYISYAVHTLHFDNVNSSDGKIGSRRQLPRILSDTTSQLVQVSALNRKASPRLFHRSLID